MPGKGRTRNQISRGFFFSTVVQGRDITVQLPLEITLAMSAFPAGNPAFTGRGPDLQELLATLRPGQHDVTALSASSAPTVVVTAVGGLAGIGKTELAVQAARIALNRGWFPGGALFVDIYGYDRARRLEPGQALEGFLRAMGIPGDHIPPQIQDRARLYASVLAAYAREGRRHCP